MPFANPDRPGLSRAFGWTGWVVDGPADLAPLSSQALAVRGSSLVTVPIDYRENLRSSKRLGRLEQTL